MSAKLLRLQTTEEAQAGFGAEQLKVVLNAFFKVHTILFLHLVYGLCTFPRGEYIYLRVCGVSLRLGFLFKTPPLIHRWPTTDIHPRRCGRDYELQRSSQVCCFLPTRCLKASFGANFTRAQNRWQTAIDVFFQSSSTETWFQPRTPSANQQTHGLPPLILKTVYGSFPLSSFPPSLLSPACIPPCFAACFRNGSG